MEPQKPQIYQPPSHRKFQDNSNNRDRQVHRYNRPAPDTVKENLVVKDFNEEFPSLVVQKQQDQKKQQDQPQTSWAKLVQKSIEEESTTKTEAPPQTDATNMVILK